MMIKRGSDFCKSNGKEYNELCINGREGLNKFERFKIWIGTYEQSQATISNNR